MAYEVPAEVLAAAITAIPQVIEQSSYAALAPSASVDLDFTITFSPHFLATVYMTVAGILRVFTRSQTSGDGSTYRQWGNDYVITAGQLFALPTPGGVALTVPGKQVRFRLVNNGGANVNPEFHVLNRSLP